MGNNFKKILIRSQAQEMDLIITKFKNLHIFRDEDDGDPKGEIINYALISTSKVSNFEPSHFDQAFKHKVWVKAIKDEMNSIMKNDIWEIHYLPKLKRRVGSKWIYKITYNNDGSVERYKEILVTKGFT